MTYTAPMRVSLSHEKRRKKKSLHPISIHKFASGINVYS
jgi:hypothetical protein